jgi:hypothetical protein
MVISENQRKRNMRRSRSGLGPRVNDERYAVQETPMGDTSLETRRDGRQPTGSGGQRTIPMDVIRREIQEVLANTEPNGEVTQTEIKDRIPSEYPDAKIPSVRSAISRILSSHLKHGELELMEEGKAGTPNRYRKKRTEGSLLEP